MSNNSRVEMLTVLSLRCSRVRPAFRLSLSPSICQQRLKLWVGQTEDSLQDLFTTLTRPGICLGCKKARKYSQHFPHGSRSRRRCENYHDFQPIYLENDTRCDHLQWKTNRNSYAVYRMAPFSVTVSGIYTSLVAFFTESRARALDINIFLT